MKNHYTYVCENTLEPKWIDQVFLLEVPSRAVDDSRDLMVRVSVKAQTLTGDAFDFRWCYCYNRY
jgi:hypothetical protein